MAARRIAISYNRFSDPKQAHGDSEDRQDRDFRNFCRRHNLTPLSEVYADRGRSGYKDEHRKKGRLGQLIAAGAQAPVAAALRLGIARRIAFAVAFAIAQAVTLLFEQVRELLPFALIEGVLREPLQTLFEPRPIAAQALR